MTFTLKIDVDNEAFADDRNYETARILRKIAERLDAGESFSTDQTLFDVNGNGVGRAAFKTTRNGG